MIPTATATPWGKGTLVHASKSGFPLFTVKLAFRGGAAHDPKGLEGLASLTARMLERGTATRSREAIADAIETMGGHLSISAGVESIRIDGACLPDAAGEFLAILADLLLAPSFPPDEIERLREEMLAELALAREEDGDLGDSFFRRALYGDHPLGRFPEGTDATLPAITRDDVVARWSRIAGRVNLIAGIAGDLDRPRAHALLDRHFGRLPEGEAIVPAPATARERKGFEALLIDKPERTQTQIRIGHLTIPMTDPRWIPLKMALHAFGGMFSARLMQEVRVKRGWSYGAAARVEMGRGATLAGVWTFPANADTIPCIQLLLELLEELRRKGIQEEELGAARSHLLNMLSFEVETPEQLIQRRIHERLLGLPDDWTSRLVAGMESLGLDAANAAVAELIRPDESVLALVCSADGFVDALPKSIPKLSRLSVVPFDTEEPSRWKCVLDR